MKNVLIPTDFSTGSLRLVSLLAAAFPDSSHNIVLSHMFRMPDGITELLMLHRSIPLSTLFTDELRSECRRLKQRHGDTIRSIAFRPVYGDSSLLLNDFLRANDIDTILYDDNRAFVKPHRYSTDMTAYFKRADAAVIKAAEIVVVKPVKEATTRYKEYVNI